MKDIIFRQYGIRGKVGLEIALEDVYSLGKAIAQYFKKYKKFVKKISIGMDGRTHSHAIKERLCAALIDSGFEVVFIGMCPTPVLYFSIFNLPADAGLMITASHNPKEYNGIKIAFKNEILWGGEIQKIKLLYHQELVSEPKLNSSSSFSNEPSGQEKLGSSACSWNGEFQKVKSLSHQGLVSESKLNSSSYEISGQEKMGPEASPWFRKNLKNQVQIPDYINWLSEHFEHLKNLKVSCVADCGNGMAGLIMPILVKKFNWPNVVLLYENVDGTMPNHIADPSVEKNMLDVKKMLLKGKFDFGCGFDGDCDRLGVMTKSGELILGDILLAIFSQEILKKFPGTAVVFDIKASIGPIDFLKKLGAKVYVSASGNSLVKAKMNEVNAIVAGEVPGHFFFKDHYFGYDDGIYAFLRLLEILYLSEENLVDGKNLEKLLLNFPKKFSTPELRISCEEIKKQKIVDEVKKIFLKKNFKLIDIDGVRIETDYGWGLIRVSHTESLLSFRFEGNTKEGLKKIENDFLNVLKTQDKEIYEKLKKNLVKIHE